jgi:hypothetical protein
MTDLCGTLRSLIAGCQLVEASRLDRNRIRPSEHLTAVTGANPITQSFEAEPVSDQAGEVPGAARKLKTHEIRPE